MRLSTVASLLACAVPIFAQVQYFVEPDSVDQAQRDKWCLDQKTSCPLICLQLPGVTDRSPEANECDPDALTYECVCSNGVAPNVTEFSQTLPFFICQEWGNQCVATCGTNNDCSHDCRANHPCGAQNPKPPNITSTASSTQASKTANSDSETGAPVTGFAGQTGSPSGDKGAASAMVNLGQGYGMAIVFAGVFAGFALIL